MPGGFRNKPKIVRGAFVEFGLSIPPLIVVFQFNPVQLTRSRSLSFSSPGEQIQCPPVPGETEDARQARVRELNTSLRDWHQRQKELDKIHERQDVSVEEESISFELRLDATDDLNEGDRIAGQFGIAPRLASLELMMFPKSESILGGLVDDLFGLGGPGFSFTKRSKPPMILFIWGFKRILPVNINSMNITETEFNTQLEPIRATVAVSLTAIESENAPYMYSKTFKEVTSALNLANIAEVANVVIPG